MTTATRRILTAAAAAGVLSLAAAGPAAADYERGSGPYSVTREGFVDDADLVYLRTGMGALLGVGITGAVVVGLHRRVADRRVSGGSGGPSRKLGDLEATPRARFA